jgi:hypothetical protein
MLCVLVSWELHVVVWVRGDAGGGLCLGVVVEAEGPSLYQRILEIGDEGGG